MMLIAVLATLVFVPFIGNCPLFDWDEVNFAECAREMVVSGNYSQVQLNYRPFWEKPPFFIWLQAGSMHLFGINEFAARFPNALCSIFSLIAVFHVGRRFHSQRFGLIWVLLYAATLLPHLYFKSGLIDPWFNLFIFLAIYNIIALINNPTGLRECGNALLAGLFLGLAVLTKGPAALAVCGLTLLAFMILSRNGRFLISVPFLIFSVTTLLVAGSWFIVEYFKGHANVISEFIDYQIRLLETGDSGHDGPFIYHFVVLLLGCFPASLLFIISYNKRASLSPWQLLIRRIFLCLFWVVLLLFSFAQTKIVHYSSLCYFPLTFIATIGVVNHFNTLRFGVFLSSLYWIIAAFFVLAFTAIGFINYYKGWLIQTGWIADEFAVQNLQADVHWSGLEFLIGLVFFAGAFLVHRAIRQKKQRFLYAGLFVNLVFIYLAIAVIIPKVERYSQHAAIEFYKVCAKQKCYVETHGFKSYAYLFYSQRRPEDYTNPDQIAYIERQLDVMVSEGHSRFKSYATCNMLWLENGKIDRPTYLVTKTKDEAELLKKQDMHKLYQENGFSFFVRLPASQP